MWCNARKFCNKMLDDKMKTLDCGITIVFKVTKISFRSDRNPKETENRYYGNLEDIIECDFNSFKIVLFEVKWYMLRMHERDPERTVIEHDNGFTMVNTRWCRPPTLGLRSAQDIFQTSTRVRRDSFSLTMQEIMSHEFTDFNTMP